MTKFQISNKKDLNLEELKTGCVSYRRIIDRYISNLIYCNNIIALDETVDLNCSNPSEEIFSYYLCDIDEYSREKLIEYGIILSYSEKLNLDILCVDHWGTDWSYVMTDIKWFDLSE